MRHLLSILIIVTLLLTNTELSVAQIIDKREINHPWKTDFSKKEVELGEFMALLPPDGIPPIDEPTFIQISDALDSFLLKDEPVIIVPYNGQAKAYPLSILMYHEIVNDSIGDFKFTVSYCPLCNASLVFNRNLEANGIHYTLDFGVSGMLRGSDMVMWDRQTQTWWQQIMGRGLVGELSGVDLEIIPAQIMSAKQFAENYSKGLCLNLPEESEQYGMNPYVNYDGVENAAPRLFFEEIDGRLRPTERVVTLQSTNNSIAFPLSILSETRIINSSFNGEEVVLFHQDGQLSVMDKADISESKDIGTVAAYSRRVDGKEISFHWDGKTFLDDQSKSTWDIYGNCVKGKMKGQQLTKLVYGVHFAFAWLHFYPSTEIYSVEE